MKTSDRKRKRKKSGKKKVLKTVLSSFLCVLLLGMVVVAAYVAYLVSTVNDIDPQSLYENIERSSFLYDSDGQEIDKLYYTEDRKLADIASIPDDTKNAFIAIEDKTFYQHHGFNFKRMLGAIFNKLTGRSDAISGTSTITQQLARNVFLNDVKSERTIKRKFSEMIYAWEIEHALSKDEILEAYLNTIYLGYGCYGIDSAARTYFDKSVEELTLSESAALAALPQAPDEYALLKDEEGDHTVYLDGHDVYANDASGKRRALVLDLMAEQGYISKSEAENAKTDIASIINPNLKRKTSAYTYFTDYLISELTRDLMSERGMTKEKAERLIYTGGIRIYSTIDSEAQMIINEEFAKDEHFPYCADGETIPQASMVITEVGTGRIVAMSGGRNASGEKLFNRAVSPRQPGSAIKPLSVYSAALQMSCECKENGVLFPFVDYGFDKQGASGWGDYITAGSYVADERMTDGNGNYWPQNYTRTYSGSQTFRTALQLSLNTCAVKIQRQVGPEFSMDMLKKYGISTLQDDTSQPLNDANPAALGLGAMTYGTTPLDMALAYAAFPGGGERKSAVCYTKVLDPEGDVILEKEPSSVKVMDEGVAWIMSDVLQSVVSKGIARNANISGTQVGGKTGTTNDAYDIWFCGFTPRYSAALWIGTDKNIEMNTTSDTAAALFSVIMSQIPDAALGEYREQPADVIRYRGEYFTDGTESGAFYRGRSSSDTDDSDSRDSSDTAITKEEFLRDFYESNSDDASGSSGSEPSDVDSWLDDWISSH